jgi:hypothetical protein
MAYELSEKAKKALRLFEDGCLSGHKSFQEKVRKGYSAYRAILDSSTEAARLAPRMRPPFVQHIVESTLSGLVDDRFLFRVNPLPRFYDPGEYKQVKLGAKAHEILHRSQLKQDKFAEKQWPFALEEAICGLAVMKTFYRRERVMRPRMKWVLDEQALEYGLRIPKPIEVEEMTTVFDGPTSEVVNNEDFFWHESAIELQRAPVIGHRVWESFSELKRQEAQGALKDVDHLKESRGFSDEYSSNRAIDNTNRTKDMIERLEIWWHEDDGTCWTVTLGNRCVELVAPRKNPFWHYQYPFVTCATRPDRFTIPGVSQVEKIMHLQDAHWDLEAQMHQNVRFLNNHIVMYDASMVGDLSAFPYEPGARWPVDGPPEQAFKTWEPDPTPATIAMPHLARYEAQMQNLAGGQPFTSTSEAQNIGADTATEAALATNIAQRATLRLRMMHNLAYGRICQQRTELSQQFIRTPVVAEMTGLDSEQEMVEIMPYLLQGDYLFDVTPSNESLMRSERRAEANARIQVLLPLLPLWVQMASQRAATPPNLDAFIEDWLEGFDEQDVTRYFSAKPSAPMPAPGQPAQPGAPQESPGMGTTAPQSIDPAVSPSANASMSGEAMMAQALRMRGQTSNT